MKIIARFDTPHMRSLIWPDSCWLQSERPLYIPDFAPAFVAIPAIATKAGRLGKHIAVKFAHRYLMEWTAAIIVLPLKEYQDLLADIIPPAESFCYDNAIVLGDWHKGMPHGDIQISASSLPNARTPIEPAEITHRDVARYDSAFFDTLSDLSLRNTVKMGDVILHPLQHISISLHENMAIRISSSAVTSSPLLSTRFK